MLRKSKHLNRGFTLIEMLLVMVIISVIIVMGIGYLQQRTVATRIDRAAAQMQQILNAALSYYVANGTWPSGLACLQKSGAPGCDTRYLPNNIVSPWKGENYQVQTINGMFYVRVRVWADGPGKANAYSDMLIGKLPLAYKTYGGMAWDDPNQSACVGAACFVTASVNIPGQNLNNASAVNFAGLYHHGACVPVPQCPVDKDGNTMTPQVFVVPVSVSGRNDPLSSDLYPISSFSAYATGGSSTSPPKCENQSATRQSDGNGTFSNDCLTYDSNEITKADKYWRACLQLITEKGDVSTTNQAGNDYWGAYVTLLAFTRCSITNEPAGSTLQVWGN